MISKNLVYEEDAFVLEREIYSSASGLKINHSKLYLLNDTQVIRGGDLIREIEAGELEGKIIKIEGPLKDKNQTELEI